MTEELWVLMSLDTYNDTRNSSTPILWDDTAHTTPDQMDTDSDIHRHLNDGGIVVIHCETDYA